MKRVKREEYNYVRERGPEGRKENEGPFEMNDE
jgi:hypothetical protein